MSSKERLESKLIAPSSPPSLVAVTIDAIHLGKELVYRVPDELSGSVGLGTPVVVSVIGKKRRGWVTTLDPKTDLEPHKILALAGLDDYGLSGALFSLCDTAAFRYGSSLVYFLKHARSAAHALPLALCDDQPYQRPGYSSTYLRISPCDRIDAMVGQIASATSARGLRTLVIFSNQIEARRLGVALDAGGTPSYLAERALPKYRRLARVDAQCILATRLGVLAPVSRLGTIIVIDPDDKGHKNVGEPTWQSAIVANERAKIENCPLVIISGHPAPDHAHFAQVRKAGTEAGCWPEVEVVALEGANPNLVTPEMTGWIQSFVGSGQARRDNPVVLLLNRKGRVNRFRCRKCSTTLRCEACHSLLVMGAPYLEPGRDKAPEALHHYHFRTERAQQSYDRLFPRGLVCPDCGLTTPPACGNCKSISISPVTVGTTRIADEIETTLGMPAELIDESTPLDAPRSAAVVVATEAALTRLDNAAALAFVDFDQYQFSSSFAGVNSLFRAWYKSAVLIVKGEDSAMADARPRLLIQTRDPDSPLLGAIVAKNPSGLLFIDRQTRRKLDLPPYSALALIKGDGAPSYAAKATLLIENDTTGAFANVDVVPIGDAKAVIKAPNNEVLSRLLFELRELRSQIVIHVDPDEL